MVQPGMPRAHDGASVTVRYWAGARAAAGVDSDELVQVGTVREAAEQVASLRPALAPVLAASSLLLDGRPAAEGDALLPGAVLEVLPPFAGG